MSERGTPKKRGAGRPAARRASSRTPREEAPSRSESTLGTLFDSLTDLTTDLTSSALKLASRTRETAARAIARSPDQLRMMASAGESLRDMREVAGLTVLEISDALNLRDKSMWEAVEDGREALSFELILRLASLVGATIRCPSCSSTPAPITRGCGRSCMS